MCDTDFNQSEWRRLASRAWLTWIHVLWKCFACPQNVHLLISIWIYSTKNTICFYIFKTKPIWAFMNGNNSLTLGLYRRLMTCFVLSPRPLINLSTTQQTIIPLNIITHPSSYNVHVRTCTCVRTAENMYMHLYVHAKRYVHARYETIVMETCDALFVRSLWLTGCTFVHSCVQPL